MLAQEKVFLLYIIFIFSLIDWRKANKEKIHRIYNKYRKPNFPKEIQASKLDKSSATKLPYGNLVWQSGQGEQSPEGNLTEVKLPENCTGRVLFTSLNFPREVCFPVQGLYAKDRFSRC